MTLDIILKEIGSAKVNGRGTDRHGVLEGVSLSTAFSEEGKSVVWSSEDEGWSFTQNESYRSSGLAYGQIEIAGPRGSNAPMGPVGPKL